MNQAMLRYEWETIPWRKLEKTVFKLQKRIYRASLNGEKKLVIGILFDRNDLGSSRLSTINY